MPSTTCGWRSPKARWSGSWANRVAASRLSAAWPRGSFPRATAACGSAASLGVPPVFVDCYAPVRALDVSIQAQVPNLFIALRGELRLTYLFISPGLGVVERLSDRVVIMYPGRVVELAATDELFRKPNH